MLKSLNINPAIYSKIQFINQILLSLCKYFIESIYQNFGSFNSTLNSLQLMAEEVQRLKVQPRTLTQHTRYSDLRKPTGQN